LEAKIFFGKFSERKLSAAQDRPTRGAVQWYTAWIRVPHRNWRVIVEGKALRCAAQSEKPKAGFYRSLHIPGGQVKINDRGIDTVNKLLP
jgi:hypothetical protein